MCTADHRHCAVSSIKNLGRSNRVWAVSAIHGQHDKLMHLHDALLDHITPGDRLVYLGNYTGYDRRSAACIDELLTFRRLLLSKPGMHAEDIVYLRGGQEEMWQKLLSLPFAQNPTDVLLWMLGHGLSETLHSYGLSPHDGIEACRYGTMGITKWVGTVRHAIKQAPGHQTFRMHVRRAAYTDPDYAPCPLLFVHSGLNPEKPLGEQGDYLWWAGENFSDIVLPYRPFDKVIRGYDPAHRGIDINSVTATLDGGCGFGGILFAAGFDREGRIINTIEV